MAESFEDLGLRAELARAAADAGFAAPTPLQRATIPLLRRGGNAVIHASSGAGVTAAWGLPLIDRVSAEAAETEAGPGARLLAVLPTAEEAGRAAAELAPFAQAAGLRLLALAPGWAPLQVDADVVLATAGDALRAVESSELKLGALAAFVVAGASALVALRGAEALDTLTASVPKEAQRILTSSELPKELGDYVERHVRKALWIPPRSGDEAPPEAVAQVGYAVMQDNEKLEWVAREAKPGTVVFCRSDDRAARLAESLMLRGFSVGAAGDADAHIAIASATADPRELPARHAVSFDAPFDGAQLTARHTGRDGAVLVLPRELPHLRQAAFEAGFALRPLAVEAPAHGLESFRQRLRDALRDEDLDAQLLVLQPLFEERSAAEVAAAASALLRRRQAAPPRAEGSATAPAGASAAGARRSTRPTAGTGAQPSAFSRLFVSVGQRDNVRPGDLVSAIAGEAGLPGDRVGRIEVRDTFSIVEVPAEDADKVIRAINGTTLKGRSVRVDYDRKRAAPTRTGERPRGGSDRPRGAGDRPRRTRE